MAQFKEGPVSANTLACLMPNVESEIRKEKRIAQSANDTKHGMTTAATNLLKSASERRAARVREREQLDSKTGGYRGGKGRAGRAGNIPVLLLLDVRPSVRVRPSICRGWDLEVGIAMTTACFNVSLPLASHIHSRSQVVSLRSHLANGAPKRYSELASKRAVKRSSQCGGTQRACR